MPEQMFMFYRNLEVVYLDLVGFKEITNFDFDNATNLKYFYCRGNQIKELDGFIFEKAINLKHLMLSSNYIKFINESAFVGVKNLQKLDLSQNYIKKLDVGLFADLRNLRVLTIIHNQLESLERDLFKHNLRLQMIFLKSNQISKIDLNLFDDHFTNLEKIALDENPCLDYTIYFKTLSIKQMHDKLSECQEIEEITIAPVNYCEEFDSREYNISDDCVQEVFNNFTNLRINYEQLSFDNEVLSDKYYNCTINYYEALREARHCLKNDWMYIILSLVGVFLLGILITAVFCYFLVRYMNSEDERNPSNKGMRYY